jgi:antitoxin component YwqK of YwqJK toxin-antitoxin module
MHFRPLFIISVFLISTTGFCQKKYHKEYFEDGAIKAEGWLNGTQKHGYWTFYHSNGNKKKEGHYKNDLAIKYWYFYRDDSSKEKEGHYKNGKQHKWWLYYDNMGYVNHKCQLKNSQKNGYCLIYEKQKLIKASKYQKGKKIKEWTDFSSFRKENKLSDLK